MSALEEETAKKCWIAYLNGHDLLTNSSSEKISKKLLVSGFGRKHPSDVPVALNGLCFKYYYDDHLAAVRVNTLDMGFDTILRHKLVYKDTTYGDLLNTWAAETAIPTEHLLVFHYTKKDNLTKRATDEIVVDLEEKRNDVETRTKYQIEQHLAATNETQNSIQSVYDMIGNLQEERRSFILLDDRRVRTLEGARAKYQRKDAPTILVALKYFDIFEQKLYFVDWLRLKRPKNVEFGEIAKYIETDLIPNTMANGGPLKSLYDLNTKITTFEMDTNTLNVPKFCFFEEIQALRGNQSPSSHIIMQHDAKETVTNHRENGNIFVFQINPFHPSFSVFLASTQDEDLVSMSTMLKCRKQEHEERGGFWYLGADDFVYSLVDMTDIQITIREETGWESHWTKALLKQYRDSNEQGDEALIDLEASHKWTVDGRTTFGTIRERLGSYYQIKPANIEIWPAQKSTNPQWDYGSDGRGEWNQTISNSTHKFGRSMKVFPLKFEIVGYDVHVFDKMTAFHSENRPSSSNFTPQIKELALFNLIFETPSFPATLRRDHWMTVTYRKNWSAKELIQYILDLVIENPVFLTPFFGRITDYIRKYEMDDNGNGVDDIQIVRKFTPSRFLIMDDADTGIKFGVPKEYYMEDEYKMPNHFSQIKYTDFKVLFLRKNDPLILQHSLRAKNDGKVGDTLEAEAQQEAVDNKVEREEHNMTFALWTYIKRVGTNKKYNAVLRVVIQSGESFKDLILREIWPYLVMNKYASGPSSSPQKEVEGTENEREKLFNFIVESYKFRIIGGKGNDRGIMLVDDVMIKPDIVGYLLPDMRLIVYLPRQ